VAVLAADVRRGRRMAYFGPTVLIVDANGTVGEGDNLTGLYFREARHLSRLSLTLDGKPPWMCAIGSLDARHVDVTYAHPEMSQFGGGGTGASTDEETRGAGGLIDRSLDLRVRHRAELDGLSIEIVVGNRSLEAIEPELALRIAADFCDLQEAHANRREQEGPVRSEPTHNGVRLAYEHPLLPLSTTVELQGPMTVSLAYGALVGRLAMAPAAVVRLRIRIRCEDGTDPLDEAGAAARVSALAAWRRTLATFSLPENPDLEAMLRSSIDDLASLPMLEGEEDEWLTLQAGMPAYPALFARDALTSGWQAALLDQGRCLDAGMVRVGRMQSHTSRDFTDEEPGRIPYQVRRGPLQRLGLTPYAAYYADFASPLMFVISLAHLYAWTGDERVLARHWDVACRILEWARTYGDRDGDGYLEYLTRSSRGTKNQAWKDSGDAIIDGQGRQVKAPIAAAEIQGYWFAAQELMAILAWIRGRHGEARALWRSAMDLRDRFDRDFWVEEQSFYALALDPDKQQVRSVSSNVGHCLAAGIVPRARAGLVVKRLLSPELFSGWGIRTLSNRHPLYNPLSYHRGTVWAVENATIAFGLRRFGFDEEAAVLARALFDLSRLYEGFRIPECVGGYERVDGGHPGAYPRANELQAWNASVFPLLMHTLLGLQPVAPLSTLVVDPALPEWLPEVVLRDLRLGTAKATLRFHRDAAGRSHAEVVSREGTFHLVRQPAPESLSVGLAGRFAALIRGLID
jgi:glycogen debranching enzyme